jgi:hypothetical protein
MKFTTDFEHVSGIFNKTLDEFNGMKTFHNLFPHWKLLNYPTK